jgi:glycine cleavage system transcriptional repressor
MKRWFALSAIGRDRPGIVADLTGLIYECDCNLEDSSMTILGTEFAVLLLLTAEKEDTAERLSSACKRLEWEKRLTVFFRPLEGEPAGRPPGARPYALQAMGVDKAGIVAKVSRCLADRDINIREMNSQSRPQAESGTPIYTMRMLLDVPEGGDERSLRENLEAVARHLNIDVTLEKVNA